MHATQQILLLTSTALHTALALLALAAGILCVHPERGAMSLLIANSAGGQIVRRLLLPVVLLPVTLNWLTQLGERRGLFPADSGWTLDAALTIALVGLLVRGMAALIHRKDEDHRAAEVELQRSEERYRKLVGQAPEGIVVKSRDRIEFVNPAAARLLGVDTPAQAIGQSALGDLHPEARRQLDLPSSARCSCTGKPYPRWSRR